MKKVVCSTLVDCLINMLLLVRVVITSECCKKKNLKFLSYWNGMMYSYILGGARNYVTWVL